MARGKVVSKALLSSSQAAMFAGIEIHNKPLISYRYPTSVILIINAWELALKAYIYKYIGKKKIYEKDGKHTISITTANNMVRDYIVQTDKNYLAVYDNIKALNEYRCSSIHFANTDLDPIIFMLMGKAVLNYDEFLKKYFNKDISSSDNLIILPIGLKLPFDPVDYLSQNYEAAQNDFVNELIQTIRNLHEQNIEDSIVIGFNLYTESVKKVVNADIIAAIDQLNGTVKISKQYRVTDDPAAPLVRAMPDLPPLRYADVVKRSKERAPELKISERFWSIMRELKKNPKYCKVNFLDPIKKSGTKTEFYTEETVDYIIAEYFSDKADI